MYLVWGITEPSFWKNSIRWNITCFLNQHFLFPGSIPDQEAKWHRGASVSQESNSAGSKSSMSNIIKMLLMKTVFFNCACDHLVINQINISPQTLLLYKSLCSVYNLLSVLGKGDYIYNYWLPTCLFVPWGQQLPKNMGNRQFLFIYISQFLTQLLVHGRSSIIMEEMSE